MNRLGQWVLRRCLSREIREAVLGDIDEMTDAAAREAVPDRAQSRFWPHLLRSLPFLLAEKLQRRLSPVRHRMARCGPGAKHESHPSLIPTAGLSIGLACCLTILAITRDLRNGTRAVDLAEGGIVAASAAAEQLAPPLPVRSIVRSRTTADSQSNHEHLRILRARRLLAIEFVIMLAAGLIFMNSERDKCRGRTHRSGSLASIARSTGAVFAIVLLARLLSHFFLPYFQFLSEKQMLLYWLVALWLIVGGISNIVPAIVLSVATATARRPDKVTAIHLAFIAAFVIGTLLIFQQLVQLKDVRTAGNEVRAVLALPDGADEGFEPRLLR